jgi:hypothetical protein
VPDEFDLLGTGLEDSFVSEGGGFSDFFSGVNFQDILNVGAPLIRQALTPNQGLPAYGGAQAYPVANRSQSTLPAVIPQQQVSRSFFNKFPGIATVIQSLKNAGKKVTANSLWGILAQLGATGMISFLSSYVGQQTATQATNELIIRGRKRRRMNSCNAKALRRAMRRVKSFSRMKNDAMMMCRPRKRRAC